MLVRQITRSFRGYLDALERFGSPRISHEALLDYEIASEKKKNPCQLAIDCGDGTQGASSQEVVTEAM